MGEFYDKIMYLDIYRNNKFGFFRASVHDGPVFANAFCMRKILSVAGIIVSLLFLCACEVSQMGTLPDLSRPYAGVYTCETIRFGGEDIGDKFDYIRLELSQDGTFTLSYRTADGKEGSHGGSYEMDTARNELTFSARTPLRTLSYTCPVREGAICLDHNFRGRLLHAEFKRP